MVSASGLQGTPYALLSVADERAGRCRQHAVLPAGFWVSVGCTTATLADWFGCCCFSCPGIAPASRCCACLRQHDNRAHQSGSPSSFCQQRLLDESIKHEVPKQAGSSTPASTDDTPGMRVLGPAPLHKVCQRWREVGRDGRAVALLRHLDDDLQVAGSRQEGKAAVSKHRMQQAMA